MGYKEVYELWANDPYFDEATRKELADIAGNEKEIEERFYMDLEFGTGGLRGIIGAGCNRINIYTVRKASQGVAMYLAKQGEEAKKAGIAIGYDSRFMSPEFAMEAAKVFAYNGIKTYVFDELRPTPELSYAVRSLGCRAGIVVTASHNPKEYNGYKVYGPDGGQLPLQDSNIVLAEINAIDDIRTIKCADRDEAIASGMIEIIGKNIDDRYIADLKTLSINPSVIEDVADDFKIIYTPIHGSGNKPVRRILDETGFKNVIVVKEQELPDCNFSTVTSPNPENKEAFTIAIEMAKKEGVDLIIGTDPDGDRVGVVVKTDDDYAVLTGNQTGLLLTDYILNARKQAGTLPEKGFIVKTIVTTELTRAIAAEYGVELVEVLTGFKFIGEQIKLRDDNGDETYLFGFEESYGYLAGKFARDKDAVVASMLIAEMAAWYYSRGMNLYQGLQELFKKYGFALEGISTFTLKGKEGIEKIQATMKALRADKKETFGGIKLKAIRDYKTGVRTVFGSGEEKITLPESNVLYYETEDGSWFCARPSGTEPKLKVYYGVSADSQDGAKSKLDELQAEVLKVVNGLLED